MKKQLIICYIISGVLLSGNAFADKPAGNTFKQLQAARVDTPPVIDGLLDDVVWQQATILKDLHQSRPHEYSEPTQKSQFYVIYDKDALYIGAYLWDTEPDKIIARVLRQDANTSDEDRIAIILDPFNDKRSGYMFILNVNNVRRDGLFVNPREFSVDWDGIWQGKSTRTEDGWTAEVAIPFKTLNFHPENETWGFNIWREVARDKERIAWVSHNRDANPSAAGELIGLKDLDLGIGLDVVPSVAVRQIRNFNRSDTDYVTEPSLNLFYKVTPSMNGSFTINTDFSATEIDERQVNLDRFSLFFPEKRDFFLKDSDIFEFGAIGGDDDLISVGRVERENARPFFSRKIGLSDTGEPVDLELGAKISGRIDQWNLGALAIRQAEFNAIDATNIFVGRLTRNILEESTVGVIMTHGDPSSNLDNTLFGFDLRYQNTDLPGARTLETQIWYQQTDTEGLSDDDAAWGLRFSMPNKTGLHTSISAKEVQENFNPALGFINRQGIRDYIGDIGYTWRPRDHYIREIKTGFEARHVDRLNGGLQTQRLDFKVFDIKNNDEDLLFFRYLVFKEGLNNPFEISKGVILQPGLYTYERFGIGFESGPQRKLSVEAVYFNGSFFNGDRLFLEGEVNWKPNKHFTLKGSYTFNDIDLPVGNFVTRLITFQSDIVFSDTLSWVNLVQFDNVSRNLGINSRLQWIPEAGRELFFVINHNLLDDINGFRSTNGDITLKFNYTYRF